MTASYGDHASKQRYGQAKRSVRPLLLPIAGSFVFLSAMLSFSAEYTIEQVADINLINRDPVISDTGLAAWHGFRMDDNREVGKDVFIYFNGSMENLSQGKAEPKSANINPIVSGNRVLWTTTFTNKPSPNDRSWQLKEVPANPDPDAPGKDISGNMILSDTASQSFQPVTEVLTNTIPGESEIPTVRYASGNNEIVYWDAEGGFERLTRDGRNDLAPHFFGETFAWQKAKGWPFGWEIMVYHNENRYQLTTNFYYDMAPRVHNGMVTYYGWDGNDFEVFLHDANAGGISQITSNDYDDVSPVIWDGKLAWMGYKQVEAEIYFYDGTNIQIISNNPEGDDISPNIWNGQVVWQGFDGEDFEIYHFNGELTVKLTENLYDDVNPVIRDETIVWMGYADNWDPEIFTWLTTDQLMTQLTTNEVEDRSPDTAGGNIIWQTDDEAGSQIFVATPK